MKRFFSDFLRYFGQIKFGEEKSILIADFERMFNRFFSFKKRLSSRQRHGEKTEEPKSLKDFRKSFKNYFE